MFGRSHTQGSGVPGELRESQRFHSSCAGNGGRLGEGWKVDWGMGKPDHHQEVRGSEGWWRYCTYAEGCWESLEARFAYICKICTSIPCPRV